VKFPKTLSPQEVGRFVSLFRQAAQIVKTGQKVEASPDPDDNLLLAIAISAKADYLISGDKTHLLQLKKIKGTKIVALSWFLEKIAPYGQ
jgi:putative PIN family toxin of toxin-antitoxin system